MKNRPAPSSFSRSGFTLLELLLATTILVAITALIAATWGQMQRWNSENAAHRQSMRLHRVLGMMRDQWQDRRTTVAIDENGAEIAASPTRIDFVTATPILFPEWPIVRASYFFEPDPDAPPGSGWRSRLMYQEARVADMSAPPKEGYDALGLELDRSMVLLSSCEELRFERFGPRVPDPEEDKPDARGSRLPQAREADDDAPINKDEQYRWRAFDAPIEGGSHAIRLIGTYQKESFACVFVVRALR